MSSTFRPCTLRGFVSCSGLSLAALCLSAHADSTLTLGTVEVSGQESGPLSSRDILSSVDVIGSDVLQQQPVQYSWELFNRAPG